MSFKVGQSAGVVAWLLKTGSSFAATTVVARNLLIDHYGTTLLSLWDLIRRGLHSSLSWLSLTSSVRSLQ